MLKNIIVNHTTYQRGPTSKGNTACGKREVKRVPSEIKFTMNRLTNPYNFKAGSEIPYVQSVSNYVVLLIPEHIKQPTISNGLLKGSSKVNMRRVRTELVISRNAEAWGRRRIHSTTFICGKESSFTSSVESWLSGQERNEELLTLKNKISCNEKAENLSLIMSDPGFLMACWVKVRSNTGSMTPAFDQTLDGIDQKWFEWAAGSMRNGMFKFSPSRRTYIPKPNGKRRPLTMLSPKNRIVQEGMRFLLELVFKPHFSDSSFGFRPNRGCHAALKSIQKYCSSVSWYLKGDVVQQFPSINHNILVRILEEKIKDQAFIDLIYKYLRTSYGENVGSITPRKIEVVQGGILSPILSNIYMNSFDQWINDYVIPKFTKRKVRKSNPEYYKKRRLYYQGKVPTFKDFRKGLGNDLNWKRIYYFRYADGFVIGMNGSKSDCLELKKKIKDFLYNKLKLILNDDKTKITHAETESTRFLGYKIHKSKISKTAIKHNSLGIRTRRSTRPILDAPLHEILTKLVQKGYAVKRNNKVGRFMPTSNGKFVNLPLESIIDHYKTVEEGIINYYCLANNYDRLLAYVHFILKYSCALTIASKMKLKTLRKVYSKYGKNLSVKRTNGKCVNYLTPSYKRPNKSLASVVYEENFITE